MFQKLIFDCWQPGLLYDLLESSIAKRTLVVPAKTKQRILVLNKSYIFKIFIIKHGVLMLLKRIRRTLSSQNLLFSITIYKLFLLEKLLP